MTKKELIKANLELQSRIMNQNKIISELNNELSQLKISNKVLTLDNNDLLEKIHYKEQIIIQYQNNKPIKERVNLDNNTGVLKKITRKNKNNYSKRKKMIHGILKNKSRYNVSQTEVKFLEGIKNKEAITPKQQTWYSTIVNRIKSKK